MIKENSFDASPGTCVSTAEPISSPARAGPEDPASVYQLIGGLFWLFSSSSPSTNHPLKGLGLLKTHLTLFSISKQMESRKNDTVVTPERQMTHERDMGETPYSQGRTASKASVGRKEPTSGSRLPAPGFLSGHAGPFTLTAPPSKVRSREQEYHLHQGACEEGGLSPPQVRICTPTRP